MVTVKHNNKWHKSVTDFIKQFGKAIAAFAAVASCFYGIGYKTADLKREREIMKLENQHSLELLNIKEEYMEKYFRFREQQVFINQNDSTNVNKEF